MTGLTSKWTIMNIRLQKRSQILNQDMAFGESSVVFITLTKFEKTGLSTRN
jgi:hypothetical protein